MTIAIGMLYDKGVLMCADSLVTTGRLGSFQSKILGYRIDGADIVFALAGNVDLAESALQQCRPVILEQAGKKRTAQEIANSLRPTLGKEYREQVIDLGYVGSLYDYSLIIVIRPEGAKAEIYHTYSKTVKKSKDGREFIGAGDDMAKYLISWVPHASLSSDKLADVAAYIVGTLKRQMPGLIGGNNLIMALPDDGDILFYRRADLELIEQYAPAYELDSYRLLWNFLDASIDDAGFDKALDQFSQIVRYYRGQFKRKGESTWSAPPDEAQQAIIDLRTTKR